MDSSGCTAHPDSHLAVPGQGWEAPGKSTHTQGGSREVHTHTGRLRPLTQSDIEDVLHGIPRLRVQDAPAHAEPDDGQLSNHAAQQDSQVAPAVVHQV